MVNSVSEGNKDRPLCRLGPDRNTILKFGLEQDKGTGGCIELFLSGYGPGQCGCANGNTGLS
jgi:hypothetical protein